MKKTTHKYRLISVLIIVLFFSIGCWEGIDELLEKGEDLSDRTVSIATIEGITPPAYGEIPVTEITETAQYSGTVTWNPANNIFKAEEVYSATITLTAKSKYTLTGVEEDFFNIAGAISVINDADSGVVTAVFPVTGEAPPTAVNIAVIEGVTPPAYGKIPVIEIIATDQYTGTINWSPDDSSFAAETVYTATITLTAKPGYTFTGVTEDFFKVAGADSVTNAADSGVVTAVFPKTFFSIGDQEIYSADGVSFKMAYVPGGFTFPTGTGDSGTATVDNDYWIGETQVTYELWNKVHDWAKGKGYTFANAGRMGSVSGGTGMTNQHPVTYINWRDSMVWCNALTEWYNAHKGTNYDCVYYVDSDYTTPLRAVNDSTTITHTTPGSQDMPYIKAGTRGNTDINSCTAKGFRLLTSNEWELAARYRGSDNSYGAYEYPAGSGMYWTPGNYASGATTYYNDVTGGSGEPGKSANDAVAVYGYYWDGSNWLSTGVTSTAVVKTKNANALGLYDMSGNVREWCFDLSGSFRVRRGGTWYYNASFMQVGFWDNYTPYYEYMESGFRFGWSH